MQQMERYFGFKITLAETLDAYRIDVLKERAALILAREDFDPKQYHLYFHHLTIALKDNHFSASLKIRDRLEELRVRFERNPKQDCKREIRFFNHLLHASPDQEVASSPTESSVTYYVSGEYLAAKLLFRNELITFISKDLRKEHQKIKISAQGYPTKSFRQQLRKNRKSYVTKLDLRYYRYTAVNIDESVFSAIGPSYLQYDDRQYVIGILARLATSSVDPIGYFRDLVNALDVPSEWKMQMAGVFTGDTLHDAKHLIGWAESKSSVPGAKQNSLSSVLGRIVEQVVDDSGDARIAQILADHDQIS